AIPAPPSRATSQACKRYWRERERHAPLLALHRDLLRLRREEPVFRRQERGRLDGAVLSAQALVLRFFGDDGDDRLLLVNLGTDLELAAAPEPLLAPPAQCRWRTLLSSEAFAYGGSGTPPVLDRDDDGWLVPGETAVVMAPTPPAG